jgi:phytoene synthase
MDLTMTSYKTFRDLSLYCYRVASVVGLICLHVFGITSARAQDYAVDLGMAFQLTNILRDLGTDAAQGRVYVPEEDLEKLGCSVELLRRQQDNPGLRELIRFEAARAHEYYNKAAAALDSLTTKERRALTVAEIMRAVYFRILQRVERSDHRPFGPRASLSTAHRLVVAAGVWLRSRFS